MRLGLLAKIGMSRYYDSVGINHAVTILKVDESKIVDLKTPKKMVILLLDFHLVLHQKWLINHQKVFLKNKASHLLSCLKSSE